METLRAHFAAQQKEKGPLEQVAVEPAAPEGSAFPGMEKARNTLVKVLKDI